MKKQGWKDYFLFTKKERTGTIILLLIIIFLMLSPQFFFKERDIPINKEILIKQEAISLTSNRSFDKSSTTKKYTEEEYEGEVEKPVSFYFDPNSLPAKDWLRLGLRERTVQTIENYRKKGGKFRKAADLTKIYGLRPEDVARLLPYVRIEEKVYSNAVYSKDNQWSLDKNHTAGAYRKNTGQYDEWANALVSRNFKDDQSRKERSSGSSGNPDYSQTPPGIKKNTTALYDPGHAGSFRRLIGEIRINRADSIEFDKLPGIGYILANRIINFRNSLGGFYSVNQVRETFGISDSLFKIISPYLICDSSSIVKININTATYEQLKIHPYIKYQLSKAIINYRKEHGPYNSIDDLLKLNAVDGIWLEKVRPYLAVIKN